MRTVASRYIAGAQTNAQTDRRTDSDMHAVLLTLLLLLNCCCCGCALSLLPTLFSKLLATQWSPTLSLLLMLLSLPTLLLLLLLLRLSLLLLLLLLLMSLPILLSLSTLLLLLLGHALLDVSCIFGL